MTRKSNAGRPPKPIPLQAIFAVRQGGRLRAVAKTYQIGKSTLARAVTDYGQRRGFFLRAPPENLGTGLTRDFDDSDRCDKGAI
jgi:hypothetical protein